MLSARLELSSEVLTGLSREVPDELDDADVCICRGVMLVCEGRAGSSSASLALERSVGTMPRPSALGLCRPEWPGGI